MYIVASDWSKPLFDQTEGINKPIRSDYIYPCVDILRNTGTRKCFMKLYISNHKLLIETGRHCRPKLPREERLCKFCPLNEIEDEMHLLFSCTLYNDRRVKFMKDQKRILGVNTDNYDNLALALFTTENKASIRDTAKFITECFILRNNFFFIDLFRIAISYD